jgi:uncharacterized protein YndB with AHSA1/START domain
MEGTGRVIGRTRGAGFQVGMRRTLPLGADAAWRLVTSPEGARAWLGEGVVLERGSTYALADGTEGEVRVLRPGSHLRLSWRPEGWPRASTVQVRVIAAGEKSTIALHQENLPSAEARVRRRAHFAAALDALERLAGAGAAA